MTTSRSKAYVIEGVRPRDQQLRLIAVYPRTGRAVTWPAGEELVMRYEKLITLAEQVCQEGCPIRIRTWWTPKGLELVELHRIESASVSKPVPVVTETF
jgi:pyruvate-formate lyase-activating enzyme